MEAGRTRARGVLFATAVFVALFGYFLTIQLGSRHLACIDVFFHMKLALLMRERGFIRDFPWMQFTVFRDHWVDQHFLFHLLLIPFTFFDNLVFGAKLAAATFAASALTAFTFFLRRRAPYPLFWLLFLVASSSGFLYRMNMVRGQSLAIVFFLVFLGALLEKRPRTAFVVGFLFVWTYQLFLLLAPMALVVVFASVRDECRPALRAPVFGLLGVVAGMVLNPFFPYNLTFLYQHAVVKVMNRARLGVGGEWGPFESWTVVSENALVFVALGVLGLFLLLRPGRVSRTTLALAGIASIFFFMLMHSRRFIEYWPPFALLFVASGLADLVPWDRIRRANGFRPGLAAAVALFSVLAVRNHRQAVEDLNSNLPPDRYRAGAEWLAAHSSPGEVVFTTDWDDFAELFFYNHQNTYLVGLDPTFMLVYNSALFYEWDQIANGALGDAAPTIRRDFNARYVFTDYAHVDFIELANRDPKFSPVFRDQECAIYEITTAEEADAFRIEGETRFPSRTTSGISYLVQNLRQEFGVSCSNDRHLFCRATAAGNFLEFEVYMPRTGRYALRAGLIMADDYGIVRLDLDGRPLAFPFDAYSPRVGSAERIAFGEADLNAGSHVVRLTITGKNPAARGYCAGLDYLEFERLGRAAESRR